MDKEKTKKTIKIGLKILNVLLIIGALATLGYYLGWKKYEQKVYQKGVNDIIATIYNRVKQTGQVQINDLILIPK